MAIQISRKDLAKDATRSDEPAPVACEAKASGTLPLVRAKGLLQFLQDETRQFQIRTPDVYFLRAKNPCVPWPQPVGLSPHVVAHCRCVYWQSIHVVPTTCIAEEAACARSRQALSFCPSTNRWYVSTCADSALPGRLSISSPAPANALQPPTASMVSAGCVSSLRNKVTRPGYFSGTYFFAA